LHDKSYGEQATLTGFKKSSVYRHTIALENGVTIKSPGRQCSIPEDDELIICIWIERRSEMHNPVSVKEVKEAVRDIARERKLKVGNKETELPGPKYIKGLKERHYRRTGRIIVIGRPRPRDAKTPDREEFDHWLLKIQVEAYSY